MKEVTKEQFKEIYFKLGGGSSTGWDLDYWNKFYESPKRPGMKYLVQEPETKDHNRMIIVTDYSSNEYRLFFMTEEAEEALFYFPDEDD
ncbi:MAG: hypothetical protein JXA42_10915 [Anaerolineales bacterium]|nr:hypothetical protein [Anaerolineales bacterium]